MTFTNKNLIDLFGIAERTFYRRIKYLKEKNEYPKQSPGDTLSQEEALLISEKLGYKSTFERFLKIKLNGKNA